MNNICRNVLNSRNITILLNRTLTTSVSINRTLSSISKKSPVVVQNNFFAHSTRCYSDSPPPQDNKLPKLLPDFPIVVWPSFFYTIKNFILFNFIIKPYLDRDFNLPDFVGASKKAVEVVSRRVAEGDVKSLDGLVTNDVISNVQQAISMMSLSQREEIAIESDDIYFSFPYQVGIIFNEEEGKEQKRFVEITMVYHTLKGLSSMRSRGEEPPMSLGMMPEYQKRISICNYRFIREFTKGVNDEWTVNLLNHFKPADNN
ncbi:unnamed protein product [Phyllotreta striolata]|uniref:Uncharacterized protein n=1 Tax=Phyllotreta striolata TaxID=444603 RepID=A0A9N9TWM4_PHYSR|nr:unnamed protein product [Phyllotreta striolata]